MFIMLVGAPASGKSTWAKDFVIEAERRDLEAQIISSDKIREELWGDESIQNNPNEVFELAHKRIIEALRAKVDYVIFDATNIKRKRRVQLMEKIKDFSDEKHCVVFAEPFYILQQRNMVRARSVPEYVINRMIEQFEMPLYSEGFNKIEINNDNKLNLEEHVELMRDYNQRNPHHSLDLLTHCHKAGKYIWDNFPKTEDNSLVATAALIHDIGKPFTQTFYNTKGEKTEHAHYYRHENVGSYLTLMFKADWTIKQRIRLAQIICYHMQPYFNKTDKAKRKWYAIFGDELVEQIEMLHEADVMAH